MGNKGGKRTAASAAEVDAASVKDADPPPLCAADADGLSDAAVSLRGCGVACVRVDDSAAALHRACFDVAKDGMDHCEELVRDDDPLVQQGARLLAQLVWHRMPALGLPDMQMPSFVQLQMLERGSGIMPHLDAATPRAEGVATIGLVGYCQASLGLRARGYEVTTRLRLRVQGIGLRWLS